MPSDPKGRPLGKAERFYWLFDRFACTNFVITTELATAPATDDLQAAFDRLRSSHPFLGTCITATDGEPSFVALDGTPFAVTWLDDDTELSAEIERQLELRFGLDEPLVRCTGQRNGSGGATLLWTFSHALTDAGSAARLVHTLVTEAGSDTELCTSQLTPPTEALFSRGVRGLRGLLLLMGTMLRDLLERLRTRAPQRPPHWPAPGATKRRLLDLPIAFDPEQTAALVARCRAEQTTVQGAICAAQLLALTGQFPSGSTPRLNIHSAVSLRPRLDPRPPDDQPGLHISMVKTLHRPGPDADLWAMAREVQAQLAHKFGRGEGELVWQLFPVGWFPTTDDGARKLARVVGNDAVTSIVTNLGRIGDAEGTDGTLRGMGFAMGAHPDCALVTAAITCGGQLRLHCGFNTEVVTPRAAGEMGATMRQLLVEL